MVRLVTRLHTCDDMSGRVVPGDQLPPLEPVQRMVRLVTRLYTCDDMSGRVVPGDQLPLWSQSSVWCDW